jgi:hypothetical protein
MNLIGDALSGFFLFFIGFLFVAAMVILLRSSFLPTLDQYIYDGIKSENIVFHGEFVGQNEPCWSGFQCTSGRCYRKGTIDDTTLFSTGICSGETREKGCTTDITLGLTTRTMCVE